MWKDIEKGFQIAFENAWDAYKNNTIPIGVAILGNNNTLIATGRNQIYTNGDGLIKFHQIAHAEINAILKLSEITDQNIHNHIRTFTLFSTMEPCPLCFGAIVMGSIRNVKFAARDNYAGATALNTSLDYIKNKKIQIHGPFDETEFVQIAVQTCYELQRESHSNILLSRWRQFCEDGVRVGEHLYKQNILQDMLSNEYEEVYNYIVKARV